MINSTGINKPGTAKVGAISKAQNCKRVDTLGFVKRQLVKGVWEIFENEIFEQCHSAEICKRGALGFFDIHCVAKYRTKRRGTLWWNPKNFKKRRIVPKKIRVKNNKGVGILCFRGSVRRCFCFGRGSGVSSMF